MQQLRLSGTDEAGEHLVLVAEDGTEYAVDIDERLRSAVRPTRAGAPRPGMPLNPREAQSLIRAGLSVEEVAELTGWAAERIEKFEVPIAAERAHIGEQARAAHVRGRGPEGEAQTLDSRVRQRLGERGIDPDAATWDSTRPEGGQWTVMLAFVAAGRHRRAAWHFDPLARTIEALDDESRWLSEDEMALPGGTDAAALLAGGHGDEGLDLMTAMREHSRSRGRRRTPAAHHPAAPTDDVLPLEDLPEDPVETAAPPTTQANPADGPGEGPEKSADEAEPAEGRPRRRRRHVTATIEDIFGPPQEEDPDPAAPDGDETAGEETDGVDDTDDTDSDDPAVGLTGDAQAEPDDIPAEDSEHAAPEPQPRKGRPSVPSWDDIMFGAKGRH